MNAAYEFLQQVGIWGADTFWFPLLIWSAAAILVFLAIRAFKQLDPLYHYHLRVATLASIPVGLLVYMLVQQMGTVWFAESDFDPAVFVVEAPYVLGVGPGSRAQTLSLNWLEPNFLIGLTTALLLLISIGFCVRLALGYRSLMKLRNSLDTVSLNEIALFENHTLSHVAVSFQQHSLVPFTFGWKRPVIVLPKSIQDDPEKTRMAIQHELVHIKRGDYILQLLLSVVEALFWFHPLIHLGSREIETWREISCDQEVLNTSGISLKRYAAMLYELLPLHRGLGSYSVPMAVQSSTLKKRIETMQYHNLYQSSVKRSLFFLFALIVGITLPMACSDLRGPEALSPEELAEAKIVLNNASIEINGQEFVKIPEQGVSSNGLFSILINAQEYGVFKFSLTPFDGGKMAGEVSGNHLEFNLDGFDVVINTKTPILPITEKANIWVQHHKERVAGFTFAAIPATRPLSEFLESNASKFVQSGNAPDDDFFVVVEEMPILIGGLASVQSKVLYPEMARRAGIEGRVTVQFIVNENGDVEDPRIIRGIGGGCDEAALAAVSEAKFEPGMQRGRPVRVQYSMPVVFRLNNSEFTSPSPSESNQ